MTHIGTKIKELRKKKDMTQEKLAEYLKVSFQAVSKWETGVASPDLSMIVPLARLLEVTTDELFGLDDQTEDQRQKELKELYNETWKTGDIEKRYELSQIAVSEYPGNLEYLNWLADAEVYYGISCYEFGAQEQIAHIERSVHYYERIIEDSNDISQKHSAIQGIVFALSDLGRQDEALPYAKQHPDSDNLLKYCLKGEELEKHRQNMIFNKLIDLVRELESGKHDLEAIQAAEKIIKIVIDDENYLWFHGVLMHNYIWQAQCLTKQKRYEEAICALRNSYEQAVLDEKVFTRAKEIPISYTSSILNKLSYDANKTLISGTTTLVEDFKEYLTEKDFDALRNRDDFKALYNL